MRKLGVDDGLLGLSKAMYVGAQSNVCVNNVFSESFRVTVIVHQGSVLSPFLFSIVMEARECKTGCPWELLYEDDLVIESKGLRVNMGKTKIMCSGNNAHCSPYPMQMAVWCVFQGRGFKFNLL